MSHSGGDKHAVAVLDAAGLPQRCWEADIPSSWYNVGAEIAFTADNDSAHDAELEAISDVPVQCIQLMCRRSCARGVDPADCVDHRPVMKELVQVRNGKRQPDNRPVISVRWHQG